jgi:alkylhydroperoxidase family enzyme
MQTRFNFAKVSPAAYKAVAALEQYVQESGLERRFIHLIKLRASQINGCAYCVDMHVKESPS